MRNSKLIVSAVAAVSVILGIGVASAADLPARTYTKAPVMVDRAYSWTGCYIGGNVGGAWGRSNVSTVLTNVAGVPLIGANSSLVGSLDSPSLRPNGFTGGGQIGCNYQTGNFVFGIEADFNAFDLNLSSPQTATGLFPIGGGLFTVNNSVKTDWLITARPRIGYAWDTVLLYVTGGLAVTKVKFSTNYFDFSGDIEGASFNTTKTGWTVGGGLEYALTRNWTTKVEYLYADFGSTSISQFRNNLPNTAPVFNHNVPLTANIVRAGVNYKFDWGSSVVARY
jgi:outer membrane immunogenic protein